MAPALDEGQVAHCRFCAIAAGWPEYEGSHLPRAVYKDARITVVREDELDLRTRGGHGRLVVVINVHFTSIYDLSLRSVPLLQHIATTSLSLLFNSTNAVVGFSQPPFPVSAPSHLVAYALPTPSSYGWRESLKFGKLSWWSVEEVVAEMKEVETNDRVKTRSLVG